MSNIFLSNIRIYTERFTLRPLQLDDACERYSSWFDQKATSKFIEAAGSPHDIGSLRLYIEQRENRDDVLFLGIFTQGDGEHIGNIKYEPVNESAGYAVMGILIGESGWRGRGVAVEVIRASALWLRDNRGIKEIMLGVSADNEVAIRAYEKVGFCIERTDKIRLGSPQALTMVWRLDSETRIT